MVVRAILAVILGLIFAFVADIFLPHLLAVLIGLAVGLLFFFEGRR